jgi:hypothetical protein
MRVILEAGDTEMTPEAEAALWQRLDRQEQS